MNNQLTRAYAEFYRHRPRKNANPYVIPTRAGIQTASYQPLFLLRPQQLIKPLRHQSGKILEIDLLIIDQVGVGFC